MSRRVVNAAINIYIKDKISSGGGLSFQVLTYCFENYRLTVSELARAVESGFAQVYAHMADDFDGKKWKAEQVERARSAGADFVKYFPDHEITIRRASDSFERSNAVAVDVDNSEPGKYRAFDEVVNSDFFKQNGFLAYHTSSSTEEHNRFRLVFMLNRTVSDPLDYRRIVSALIFFFGSDATCSDSCRVFYGSSKHKPVQIGNVLPDEELSKILSAYDKHLRKSEKMSGPANYGVDARSQKYSHEQVREMLSHIPPRPDYRDWIKIIGAVVSEVGEEAAIELLKEWSPEEKTGEYYEKVTRGSLTKSSVATLVWYARQYGYGKRRYSVDTGPVDNGELTEQQIWAYFSRDEYGDAQLFAYCANVKYAYDHSTKTWYIFDVHWQRDKTSLIKQIFVETMAGIYERLAEKMEQLQQDYTLKLNSPDVKREDKPKIIEKREFYEQAGEALRARVKKLYTSRRVNSCFEFLRSIMGISGEQWDRNPMLLGVANGVVELNTGIFREAEPQEYIKTYSPTEWKGIDAPCERFLTFLGQLFGEDLESEHCELSDFVWRLLGYSVSGLTTEHIYPVLWGPEGRNGKTVLLETISYVLGDKISHKVSDELVMKGRPRTQGAPTPELYDLMGVRLAWVSETTKGRRIDPTAVKSLSGGDQITARPPFGQQVNFYPTHTLFLVTNYKPVAPEDDSAFWERVLLIPFFNRFVDEPVKSNEYMADKNLREDLKKESAGILAWLVRGFNEYSKSGIMPPESVKHATKEYRLEMDVLDEYLQERTQAGTGSFNQIANPYTTQISRLFNDYRSYCSVNKKRSLAIREFSKKLRQKFPEEQFVEISGRKYLVGLAIVDDLSPSAKTFAGQN